MKYKISIIMPIYNVEKYLNNALNSILNQTIEFENLEVIMVDDASTDNSGKIMDQYSEKYENFISIHLKENSGTCSLPRNYGLKIATADYIMFLDPDDTYRSDYCEVVYNKIIETNADIVKCSPIKCINNKLKYYYYLDKNINEKEFTSEDTTFTYSPVWNGIYKSSMIKKHELYFVPYVMAEDLIFLLDIWLHMNKMIYLNQHFGYVHYTYEEASHARQSSKKKFYEELKGFYILKERACEKNGEYLLPSFIEDNISSMFFKVMDYNEVHNKDMTRLEFLKEIYKFEKSLNFDLNIKEPSLNIGNKLLMKKLFKTTNLYLKLCSVLMKSDFLVKIHNKL